MAAAQSELSSLEKELFIYTQEKNYEEVKRLLTVEKVPVDCVDAEGMTPLQHAAYKGTHKVCKLLLDCGADVNLTKHVSQYSALTFAALSGNPDVVNLLLQYGAITTSVNSINKTAAQMAAFVGNHYIVSVINNFIPISEIEYFCQKRGFEMEPILPLNLTPFVHKMSIMANINPVALALYLQNNLCILDHAEKVIRVFTCLSEKFYRRKDNELMSLKFHHMAFVIEGCFKFLKSQKAKDENKGNLTEDCLNPFIKHLIKGDSEGFPMALEKFLRQDIQKYPYLECKLFQQLVRTLSSVQLGDEPSAISIISEAVNGQRGLDPLSRCATCGDPFGKKKCSTCKSVYYCDKTCQKLHWFTHKTQCPILVKMSQIELADDEAKNQCSGGAEIPSTSGAEKGAFSNSDGAGCSHD
ncbi:ankyrin repeat and MYND domain-containing protein 2 [Trichonephila inaurata madagascariensis]|uniref:Ankyrin repeat and MYND domain-containing protein 2 n=1 Tax=Trichonephila inaurata madagascariensis TaxID=2747483 RepID=A0A8X6M822_9ARAC|nr:ankyrin repeat and MYND domain-containing protein 2 [Trichonephila inaurata madagascariensis]